MLTTIFTALGLCKKENQYPNYSERVMMGPGSHTIGKSHFSDIQDFTEQAINICNQLGLEQDKDYTIGPALDSDHLYAPLFGRRFSFKTSEILENFETGLYRDIPNMKGSFALKIPKKRFSCNHTENELYARQIEKYMECFDVQFKRKAQPFPFPMHDVFEWEITGMAAQHFINRSHREDVIRNYALLNNQRTEERLALMERSWPEGARILSCRQDTPNQETQQQLSTPQTKHRYG